MNQQKIAQSFDHVTVEWILKKLADHNMTKMDLARELGQKHQNLYRVVGGPREMTNWHKSAFHFYFKSLER